MVASDEFAIDQQRQRQIQRILQEIEQFGSFKSQFQKLKKFRKSLRRFYYWRILNQLVSYKITKLPTGDILDHHIAGYFAPFSFKRKSWGGGK